MERTSRWRGITIVVVTVGIAVGGSLGIGRAGNKAPSLPGRIVAVGIPGI